MTVFSTRRFAQAHIALMPASGGFSPTSWHLNDERFGTFRLEQATWTWLEAEYLLANQNELVYGC